MTAFNSAGEGAPSSLLYFVVGSSVSPPPAPTIVSPGSGSAPGSSISTTTPTFQWNSVSIGRTHGCTLIPYPYRTAYLVYSTTVLPGTSFTIHTEYLSLHGALPI